MIKHKNNLDKKIQKVKKLFKGIDTKSMPHHHGVEWAKLIIREHQEMKENEANWAELQEFYIAMEILADSGEEFAFYM
jgi:hypothetical protein